MDADIYKSPESELEKSEMVMNKKLTSRTLFRLIFIGYVFGMGSLMLLDGIYALISGAESFVSFNGEQLAGLSGFIGTLIFMPISAITMTLFNWVFMLLGLWVYSLFKGPVKLEFKE